jgi:hypothetical protein
VARSADPRVHDAAQREPVAPGGSSTPRTRRPSPAAR